MEYVVQNGFLFNVTLGNYATKTTKKTVKKLWKWLQIALGSLGTNGMKKKLILSITFVALYHCMYKIKCKKATSLIIATKTAKKQYKTLKMAPNSQILHLN